MFYNITMLNKKKLLSWAFVALLMMLAISGRALCGRDDPRLDADRAKEPAKRIAEEHRDAIGISFITVANDPGHLYSEKVVVKYHPDGTIYIFFDSIEESGKRTVSLYKYTGGSKATFVKTVSETNLMAYEPDLVIAKDGLMHFVWAEGADANAVTQYIKYRTFNGSTWSPIITLKTMTIPGTVTGNNDEKVDDVRLAVDDNGNIFVVNTIWMAARCESLSRYNGVTRLEAWPSTTRSKHSSVAVDANYVHVAWVGLIGNTYYVQYARRNNTPGSPWNLLIPVDSAVSGAVDRPFLRLNNIHVPQLVYLKTNSEGKRNIHYRSKPGTAFTKEYVVTNKAAQYHPPELAAFDSANLLVFAQTWGHPSINYYNWYKNGAWSGWTQFSVTIDDSSSMGGCDLSSDGQAAISYSAGTSVQLALLEGSGPPPTPSDNLPPTASFTFYPTSGVYPLTATFNAGSSADSDGQIVSYHWNFGDGADGTGPVVSHVYEREGLFRVVLRVTDDDGATAQTSGSLEVFGVAPPLNLQYQRHENRNLFSIEYLYRLTWNHNPRNDQIGAKIAFYKIYRREVGRGDFSHFYTVPAGNLTEFEYLDRTLGATPKTYEYVVSSVDTNGRESTWK
jgi:chitodextrinase